MKNREKEIKYLMYLKNELIKQTKKEIKELRAELNQINGYKVLENDNIKDGTIFEVIGDFFYKLIVIDKNLYCINEMTKQLEILDSKYIGRFNKEQYDLVELNDEVEIIEEEKEIPEKLNLKLDDWTTPTQCDIELSKKVDEIIDYLTYLKSKGE